MSAKFLAPGTLTGAQQGPPKVLPQASSQPHAVSETVEPQRHGDGERARDRTDASSPPAAVAATSSPADREQPSNTSDKLAKEKSNDGRILTVEEMNKYTAKALKAKLMGDMATYEKLMRKVEAAKELQVQQSQSSTEGPSTASSSRPESRHQASRPDSREERFHPPERNNSNAQPNVRVIQELDAKGVPIQMRQVSDSMPRPDYIRKAGPVPLRDEHGHRLGYFQADAAAVVAPPSSDPIAQATHERAVADTSIAAMLREERASRLRGEGSDDAYMRNLMRAGKHFRGPMSALTHTEDQYDDVDNELEMYESKSKKLSGRSTGLSEHDLAERERKQAIRTTEKLEQRLNNCLLCPSAQIHRQNPQRDMRHLIVSVGLKLYLALPAVRRLCRGHCIIAPIDHIESQREFDENTYEELQYFKKHIAQAFAAQGQYVVFFETVIRGYQRGSDSQFAQDRAIAEKMGFYQPQRSAFAGHTQIECVPLSATIFRDAPIYFQKAILDIDSEDRVNRKLIDLSQKGFMKSIPDSTVFSYFAVEFGIEPARKAAIFTAISAETPYLAKGLGKAGADDDEAEDEFAPPEGVLSMEVQDEVKAYREQLKAQPRAPSLAKPANTQTGAYPMGYAHIIEERSQFSNTFAHEILCSLLSDEPFQIVIRKPRQTKEQELARVKDFRTIWDAFDWTKRLKVNQTGQPRF